MTKIPVVETCNTHIHKLQYSGRRGGLMVSALDSRGVEIFLVASCYRNQDKLRPGEPHGSYANFTLSILSVVITRL